MKFPIQLGIIVFISLKGIWNENICHLENEDNVIRKVSLITAEPIRTKSADLYHKKPETDENEIVKCDWNTKFEGKRDPCIYNEDDFIVTEPSQDTLSVDIKTNAYCQTCGSFYFKRFSDIINCLQRKETTKQKNGAMKNGFGIEVGVLVVIVLVHLQLYVL